MRTDKNFKLVFVSAVALLLAACSGGGGGGGGESVSDLEAGTIPNNEGNTNAGNACSDANSTVTITGQLTFDHVPFGLVPGSGLDYNNIERLPAPGIRIQAICNDGALLSESATNAQGNYSLTVPANQPVFIRARAQLLQTSTLNPAGQAARWDVRVLSNTGGNALYVLDGTVADTTASDTTRNLHAASGWNATQQAYKSRRSAAPFTMLNDIYAAIQKTVAVDADVVFPPLIVNWSPNNRTCSGNLANGCIGTSFYSDGQLYILGAADSDTDEYDEHIIIHEWGHYFEDRLSRSDSIGGPHSLSQALDMRVAMGEGFGNALSGIVTDDPVYRDSLGDNQGQDFSINVEQDDNSGWYNEGTVQSVIYDLYDGDVDSANDLIELEWQPLYETFTSEAYRNAPAFTSVFNFLDYLQDNATGQRTQIQNLANSRGINSLDQFAVGETNNAGNNSDVLPVYTVFQANDTRAICSIDQFGTVNKLSNVRFMQFTPDASGQYRFQASAVNHDPDAQIYRNGQLVKSFLTNGNENDTVNLTVGFTYVVAVYAFENIQSNHSDSGRICINVRLSRE